MKPLIALAIICSGLIIAAVDRLFRRPERLTPPPNWDEWMPEQLVASAIGIVFALGIYIALVYLGVL